MNKQDMKKALKGFIPQMEHVDPYSSPDMSEQTGAYKSVYLGSFMALDPCGRYHHLISPNGITNRCMAYWEQLEACASELGGWVESGEGDPTDIFFCMPAESESPILE